MNERVLFSSVSRKLDPFSFMSQKPQLEMKAVSKGETSSCFFFLLQKERLPLFIALPYSFVGK